MNSIKGSLVVIAGSLIALGAMAADPGNLKAGAFEVTPQLKLDTKFSDNIYNSPDDEEDDKEPDDEEDDADFAAEGLDFSDDDDALDIHIDSEDELRTSFPKNKLRKNMILGGPQAPDPAGLTEDEYRKMYSKFRRERKRYTDKMRNESAKRSQGFGGKSGRYSGCCNEQLRWSP